MKHNANLGHLTGAWVCDLLPFLEHAADKINDADVPYDAQGGSAPNSTSALHYIMESAGLSKYFDNGVLGGATFTIPESFEIFGWNTRLPGLE